MLYARNSKLSTNLNEYLGQMRPHLNLGTLGKTYKAISTKNSVEFFYNNDKPNEPTVISNSFNKFFTTLQAPKD